MSVATLSRFTVPLASDQSATAQGILMPKLKWRFRAILENFGVSSPRSEVTKQIMDITRPSLSFETLTLDIYNSKVNLAGKYTWEPITINVRDDVNGAVSRLIGEQIQKQMDFFEQASAASGINYKFVTRYEMLDGGNGAFDANVLETWELVGCYIESVNYNDMNYATSEHATISLTVRFDNAVQSPRETGIGADVGRAISAVATG